jgi:hypothetical protein
VTTRMVGLFLAAGLASGGPAMAKRAGPPVVPPLVHQGVTYRAGHARDDRGNRGTVEATDAAGQRLWTVTVYEVPYTPGLETDVQDVFIARLGVDGRCLRVTDERGRAWCVDLRTGAVTALAVDAGR